MEGRKNFVLFSTLFFIPIAYMVYRLLTQRGVIKSNGAKLDEDVDHKKESLVDHKKEPLDYLINARPTNQIRKEHFQNFCSYLSSNGFKNGEGKVAIVTLAIAGRVEQYFDEPLGDKEIPIVIQRNKNFSSPVDKLSDPFDGRMIVVYFDEDKFQFRSPEDEQNLKSQLFAN
eukprot:TRINITY_DN696_c0_g1_i1.p1 TRINITY_DN696_c0_g1~~TRINITY_DN696_c0_g1_i1.p1  ORF type:complete len:180 (-),score=34.49 TRINITY_DN696_c0_g1_i1:60-575(-)